MSNRSGYTRLIPVVALLLIAFFAGLYQLPDKSLFSDEAFSIDVARKGPSEMLSATMNTEPQPPLYYLLFSLWLRIAGDGEFAARYFSVLGAVAVVAIIYALANTLGGRRAALLAAGLAVLNPYLIYYAQYVRIYTLSPALAGLTLLSFIAALRNSTWRRWAIVAALTSAGGYSSYFNLLPSAFLGLVSVLLWILTPKGPRKDVWLRASLAHLAAGVTLLLWLPVTWHFLTSLSPGVPRWRTFVGPVDMVWRSLSAYSLGHAVDLKEMPWLALSFVVLGLLWLFGVRHTRAVGDLLTRRMTSIIVIGYAVFPPFVILIVSFVEPLYHERYMMVVFPIVLATASLAISKMLEGRRRVWPALSCLCVILVLTGEVRGLAGWYFDPRFTKDDFRGMVAYMEPRIRQGDAVLISAGYVRPAVEYYLRTPSAHRGPLAALPSSLNGPALVQVGQIGADEKETKYSQPADDYYSWISRSQAVRALEKLTAISRRIWMVRVYDTVNDPESVVLPWLRANLFELHSQTFGGTSYPQLYLFSTRRPPDWSVPPMENHHPARFGNAAELLGHDLSPRQAKRGNLLQLRLYWRAIRQFERDYKVFVHLLDHRQRQWAGVDHQPLMNRYPTSKWQPGEVIADDYDVWIPRNAPPGLYRVEIGMYDPSTGQRLADKGFDIDHVTVRHAAAPSADAVPVGKRLGNIELVAKGRLQFLDSSGVLRVNLFWRGTAEQRLSYTVFVHVLDSSGALVAQHDSPPADGSFPTDAWPVGDLIEDPHEVSAKKLKPGTYRLLVGIYDPVSGQRLKSPEGMDYIELGSFELNAT